MKKLFKAVLALAMACTLITNATTTKAASTIVDAKISTVENQVLGTVQIDDTYNMTATLAKGGSYDLSVLRINATTSNLEKFGIPSTTTSRDVSTGIDGIEISLDSFLNEVAQFNTATVNGTVNGIEYTYTLTNTTTAEDTTHVISGTASKDVDAAITELYKHATVIRTTDENGAVIPAGTEHYGDDDSFTVFVPAGAELVFKGYNLILNEDTTVTLTGEGVGKVILEQIEDVDFKAIQSREELLQIMVMLLNPIASAINNKTVALDVEFEVPFKDLKAAVASNPNIWYRNYIVKANAYGLMTGAGDKTSFGIGKNFTRAELVMTLYRLAGSPTTTFKHNFPDVTADWYQEAIKWAVEKGIVTGYKEDNPNTTINEKGLFLPDQAVTREEFVTMVGRYAKTQMNIASNVSLIKQFPDGGKVADWASEFMKWAVEKGIITGKEFENDSNKYLKPQDTALREEAATVIVRFYEFINK